MRISKSHPRASFTSCPALIESLEPRQLLSGYVLDTSFGNGGVLANVEATSIRADGSIITDSGSKSFLLNADGTPGVLSPSLAPLAVPTPPQPTNKQADGKHLTVTTVSHPDHIESGTLTRYNKNGTIDTTFGKNGSLTDFSFVGDPTFAPQQAVVVGTRIYVIGVIYYSYNSQWDGSVKVPGWAMVALKPNGSLDSAFKPVLQTVEIQYGESSSATFAGLGADGTLYLKDEMDYPDDQDDPYMGFDAISPSGKAIAGTFNGDQGFGILVDGPVYSPTGLATFLLGTIENSVVRICGPYGSADVSIPIAIEGNVAIPFEDGSALASADNRIFVNYVYFDAIDIPSHYLLCYRPVADNTGAVSGHFFNDVNANGKLDKTEGGLATWQAYADINNNGVFDLGEPTAYADVLGNYTIPNLTPGTYHIREVRKAGWNRTSPGGDWPTGGVYTVTVAANKTVTNLNFGNTDTKHGVGSISGTIFNDVNGNRIQDAGEPGLTGWQVYADFNNNGVYDAGEPVAMTNRNGNYKFTNLPQGGYRIREVRQSGWGRTSPPGDWPLGFYDSDIVTGQNIVGDDFGNAKGNSVFGAVKGAVFNDVNGNGKLDSGEKPVAGIIVYLMDPYDDVIRQTTTGADGTYSITDIDPAMSYGIFVHQNNDAPIRVTSPTGESYFALRPSQILQTNVFIQHLARFGVAIYNDVNGNAHIDPGDGPGFSGQVYIDLNDNGQLDAGEPTISAGYDQQFSDWIAPGRYYLRLVPKAGWISTYPSVNNPMVVTLVTGQTLSGLIFTVHQTI